MGVSLLGCVITTVHTVNYTKVATVGVRDWGHVTHASQCPALNLSINKKRNIHTHTVNMLELLKRFWCHGSCEILCDLLYSSDVAADTAFHTHTHSLTGWSDLLGRCQTSAAAEWLAVALCTLWIRRCSGSLTEKNECVCVCRHKGLCCSACCTHASAHLRSDPPLRAPALPAFR